MYTRLCLCARLRWLILWSGETGPDGASRLAVYVVTELMMLFMKFIDPICIAPRVPSPISMSVFLPLRPLSIHVRVAARNPTLHIQHAHSLTCISVDEHSQTPQTTKYWPEKNLQAVTSHTLCSNLMEPSLPSDILSLFSFPRFDSNQNNFGTVQPPQRLKLIYILAVTSSPGQERVSCCC